MDTNEALRGHAQRLIKRGVNQKAIADAMGLSQATFSRWINEKAPPVSVTALDGFRAYVRELIAEASDGVEQSEETPRVSTSTSAESEFRGATKRRGATGTPPGASERRHVG
jgi:predicted transcriptional regulator